MSPEEREKKLKRLTKAELIDIVFAQHKEINLLRIDREEHRVSVELEQHIALARKKRGVKSE